MKRATTLLAGCILVVVGMHGCGADATNSSATKPQVTVNPAEVKSTNIIKVNSAEDFAKALETYADRLMVVDFHAEWCGPCKVLAPELAAVAAAHPESLIVLTVDVDHLPALANKYQAESIPLLVQIKAGKEIKRQVGATGRAALTTWMDLK
jgi:thioredoxin